MDELNKLYKEFLNSDKTEDQKKEFIAENQNLLEDFSTKMGIENKSIIFLPAYFNFIEFYLNMDKVTNKNDLKTNMQEVKKYLIVGLSNIMFSNKKDNEKEESEEDEYSAKDKKKLKSRLDLLFARYNLLNKHFDEALDKLTSSIIQFSELFGPESIGLTIHYYYLAIYFDEKFDKDKSDVIRGIVSRIAEIWKKYFLGERFEQFDRNIY